jgi:ribose 1,5-bisphosphokinase
MSAAEEGRGLGCLVLVVGPSGAGKDTLLALAAAALGDEPRVVFGRRIVTREADGTEDHDSMSWAAFAAARSRGEFALAWEAHGYAYGVPLAATRRLAAGDTLVFNVSRAVIGAARAQFPGVAVVSVTASAEVLASRLKARGRDGDIAARLARSTEIALQPPADLVIDNVGDREANAAILVKFLRETLA